MSEAAIQAGIYRRGDGHTINRNVWIVDAHGRAERKVETRLDSKELRMYAYTIHIVRSLHAFTEL